MAGSAVRGLAAAVLVGGVGVGAAAPARADDFDGTYTLTGPGTQSTWVVTPCGAGCADIADSRGWTARAQLAGGMWTFSVDRQDGYICLADGSTHPGTVRYAMAAATLTGTGTGVDSTGACGNPPGSVLKATAFTLVKAPAPLPG